MLAVAELLTSTKGFCVLFKSQFLPAAISIRMSISKKICELLLISLLGMLYLASALPMLQLPDANDGLDLHPNDSLHDTSLVKRHQYNLLCGTIVQHLRPEAPFEGQEDIKLSRKCLVSRYQYMCDAGL